MLQTRNDNFEIQYKEELITGTVRENRATKLIRGEIRNNEPMSRHTSWRAGGNAERFFIPADIEDLSNFLKSLGNDESVMWIGLGSNLLVRDKGVKGTVISTSGILNELKPIGENQVSVGAGVPCAKVARYCANAGFKGAEFLAGIPGTFGGALAMNAGAFGGETWDIVSNVEILNRDGQKVQRKKDDFKIGYRHVNLSSDEWFVSAIIELSQDRDNTAYQNIKKLIEHRAATQPLGQASCGSVFKNPPGDHAARLIESSGLKGKCIGNACVSEMHANFIINNGNATASEIEQLITHIQDVVKKTHGIDLIPEVKIVGEV